VFLGGVLNALAGGDSLVTFPALLFAGLNPIDAYSAVSAAPAAGHLVEGRMTSEPQGIERRILLSALAALPPLSATASVAICD